MNYREKGQWTVKVVRKKDKAENFYWRADDYVIELTITYNNMKTQRYKFKFSMDVSEADSLKGNIDKSLQSVVDEIYRVPTNLSCPRKDFVLDDGEYTTFKTEKL